MKDTGGYPQDNTAGDWGNRKFSENCNYYHPWYDECPYCNPRCPVCGKPLPRRAYPNPEPWYWTTCGTGIYTNDEPCEDMED